MRSPKEVLAAVPVGCLESARPPYKNAATYPRAARTRSRMFFLGVSKADPRSPKVLGGYLAMTGCDPGRRRRLQYVTVRPGTPQVLSSATQGPNCARSFGPPKANRNCGGGGRNCVHVLGSEVLSSSDSPPRGGVVRATDLSPEVLAAAIKHIFACACVPSWVACLRHGLGMSPRPNSGR